MYDRPARDKRIGQILLGERLINQGQLEQALTAQAQQSVYKPLGEVLKDLGFISRRDLRGILSKYRKQILLGELFVNMGIISPQQLDRALRVQKNGKKKLGEVLVDLQFVTKSQLTDAICIQSGVEGVFLKHTVAERRLLRDFNALFLRRKRVVPLRYDPSANILTLLMEDPSDEEAITDLKKMYKAEIQPVMLRDGSVGHLLDQFLDVWHLAK